MNMWPEHFPESCPPDMALDPNGEVYRFVSKDPPSEKDFISMRLRKPQEKFEDLEKECRACGLSVLSTLEDIEKMRRRLPPMKKKLIAIGNLGSKHGKILHTPSFESSHHTWWVPRNIYPWKIFKVIPKG
jgi:hypothetical protein